MRLAGLLGPQEQFLGRRFGTESIAVDRADWPVTLRYARPILKDVGVTLLPSASVFFGSVCAV